jgi:hypothetical protein
VIRPAEEGFHVQITARRRFDGTAFLCWKLSAQTGQSAPWKEGVKYKKRRIDKVISCFFEDALSAGGIIASDNSPY